jgi:succinate-semialdehyde dehydrogenase/glutarate-semialdehyde dehydrogenase
MAEGVTVGPLATPAICEELDQQVQACLAQGAKALIGGDVAALKAQLPESLRHGNFFPPTF